MNDEELVMDVGETQYFYYEGEERRYEPKEDWSISREYETELTWEYESEDESGKDEMTKLPKYQKRVN